MADRDGSAAAIGNVVLVNEDIKRVVRCAFGINLMALNAILVARRAGSAAAGFGIVAAEMRQLSGALEGSMGTLRRLSDELLATVTRAMRHARVEAVLLRTASQGETVRHRLEPVLERSAQRRADIERRIRAQCRNLLNDLDGAVRVSRLADSLAHMAKIEASWSADHRTGLAAVSDELAQSLRGILPLLKGLTGKLQEIGR